MGHDDCAHVKKITLSRGKMRQTPMDDALLGFENATWFQRHKTETRRPQFVSHKKLGSRLEQILAGKQTRRLLRLDARPSPPHFSEAPVSFTPLPMARGACPQMVALARQKRFFFFWVVRSTRARRDGGRRRLVYSRAGGGKKNRQT